MLPTNDTEFNLSGFDNIIDEFLNDFYGIDQFNSVVLVTLYVPTFILSLTGNALVLYVVAKRRNLRTVKNYLLINLTCADLMITCVCVPTAISSIIYRPWIYGQLLCKLSFFAQGVAVAASIFTLTVMSVHRFVTLRFGEQIRSFSRPCHVAAIILTIWLASGLILVPVLFVRNIDEIQIPVVTVNSIYMCVERWPNDHIKLWYCAVCLLIVFVIPSIVISVCYVTMGRTIIRKSRSRRTDQLEQPYVTPQTLHFRRGAARMLIVLVIAFICSWLPYNIASLLSDVMQMASHTSSIPFVLWLGHAHSAMNPVMYWCLNVRLRRECSRVVSCRGRHNIYHNARRQRLLLQKFVVVAFISTMCELGHVVTIRRRAVVIRDSYENSNYGRVSF